MTTETESSQARTQKLEGLGTRRKRVEDVRFTQGKGNYIDDFKLPGMLFGDFVRAPYGHARVKSIDKKAALALPGVKAVLTADDLKPLKLHWMPTLAGDVQAVLADEKVLFQGEEVAFVVAENRYVAADAVDLVAVEYEDLPALVDPNQSMAAAAPVLRDDLQGKTSGAHGPRKHHNHIFTWEVGDAAGTARAISDAPVAATERIVYQRVHPCPLETCGCVASMDKVNGHLTVWGTFQAPHAVRTVASLISGIPGHKIRIVSPDIGGGFGNKVGVYPGYICSIVASIVHGVPVKWVEDRMENLQATAFARDYHMSGEIAATQEGRITALRVRVLADHGAFDALFSISQATRIQIRLIGRQAPRRCLLLRRTPPNVRLVAQEGRGSVWPARAWMLGSPRRRHRAIPGVSRTVPWYGTIASGDNPKARRGAPSASTA